MKISRYSCAVPVLAAALAIAPWTGAHAAPDPANDNPSVEDIKRLGSEVYDGFCTRKTLSKPSLVQYTEVSDRHPFDTDVSPDVEARAIFKQQARPQQEEHDRKARGGLFDPDPNSYPGGETTYIQAERNDPAGDVGISNAFRWLICGNEKAKASYMAIKKTQEEKFGKKLRPEFQEESALRKFTYKKLTEQYNILEKAGAIEKKSTEPKDE